LEALKEHFEALLREKEVALTLAREVAGVRLEALNHFKDEAIRKEGLFLRAETYDIYHAALERRVKVTEDSLSRIVGIGIGLSFVIGILGWVIGHSMK